MMPDKRSDPKGYEEVWKARHAELCRAYLANEFPVTDAVFAASLYGLGFRGQELEAEIKHYKQLKG